jgi:hypothetical protein
VGEPNQQIAARTVTGFVGFHRAPGAGGPVGQVLGLIRSWLGLAPVVAHGDRFLPRSACPAFKMHPAAQVDRWACRRGPIPAFHRMDAKAVAYRETVLMA